MVYTIYKPNQKSLWHTAYIGLASYPNNQVDTMCDDTGFDLFQSKTGNRLSGSLASDLYKPKMLQLYSQTLKEEYFRIVTSSPEIPIKNFTLNFFQLFFVGHIIRAPLYVKYVFALLGLLQFATLVYYKNISFSFFNPFTMYNIRMVLPSYYYLHVW